MHIHGDSAPWEWGHTAISWECVATACAEGPGQPRADQSTGLGGQPGPRLALPPGPLVLGPATSSSVSSSGKTGRGSLSNTGVLSEAAWPPGDSWQCLQTFLAVVTRGAGIWRVEAGEAAKTLQCTGQGPPQRIAGPNGRGPRSSCPAHRHQPGEPFTDRRLRLLISKMTLSVNALLMTNSNVKKGIILNKRIDFKSHPNVRNIKM